MHSKCLIHITDSPVQFTFLQFSDDKVNKTDIDIFHFQSIVFYLKRSVIRCFEV